MGLPPRISPFIADLVLREKQIQQNYRPIIAVHMWFARKPGTLFRGLLLSEFLEKPFHVDLGKYLRAVNSLCEHLEKEIGYLFSIVVLRTMLGFTLP